METNIIDAKDAAGAFAGISSVEPFWATLDVACWQPTIEGHGQPERGAGRAMLVAASIACGGGFGRWWRKAHEDDEGGVVVRMPDDTLLAPLGHHDEPTAITSDAHAIVSSLVAGTQANLSWTRGARVRYDCACRHQVSIPVSPTWGSTREDLCALVCALAWELTMRRGSARHPPEFVVGLAAAFALVSLGVDPSVAHRARVSIERPRCIDTTQWRKAIVDDPSLMLSAADEAELVAGELCLPIDGHPTEPAPTLEGRGEGPSGKPERTVGECGPHDHVPSQSPTLRQTIQKACIASYALSEGSRHARGRG